MTGAAGSFDKLLVAPVGRGNVSSTHGGTCDASLGVGGARGDGAAPAGRDGGVCGRGLGAGWAVAGKDLSACEAAVLLDRIDAGGCLEECLGDDWGDDAVRSAAESIAVDLRAGRLPDRHPLVVAILTDCVDGSTWHLSVPWNRTTPEARKENRTKASLLRKLRAWGLPASVEFPS